MVYLLAKGDPLQPAKSIGDVIDWTYTGNKLHPTQKPFPAPSGIVLNPLAGSGSRLMAAKQPGRDYPGIEPDAEYHAIAARRLE